MRGRNAHVDNSPATGRGVLVLASGSSGAWKQGMQLIAGLALHDDYRGEVVEHGDQLRRKRVIRGGITLEEYYTTLGMLLLLSC
jgi:hypothetical protein